MRSIAIKHSDVRRCRKFGTGVFQRLGSCRVAGARVAQRPSRAFFLARTTHHMRSPALAHDLFALGAMLLGIATWGTLLVLLAG